jgi:hypothetical protein
MVAEALRISEDDVRDYFTDGRRVSFIIERRIAREVLRARPAESEGAGFDLIDPEGGKWEVRSISGGGSTSPRAIWLVLVASSRRKAS